MMDNLNEKLIKHTEFMGPPSNARCIYSGFELPPDFHSIIKIANGFISQDRAFRFFSVGSETKKGELQTWNDSTWKLEYGSLLKDIVIIGEDLFGDQYGYYFGGGVVQFVKFLVEGGVVELIEDDLCQFLCNMVLTHTPNAFDWKFAHLAFESGITKPQVDEHLAFSLPLIAGGDYSIANLTIEPSLLHLSVLGQMSRNIRSLRNGTQISRFIPYSNRTEQ